MRNQVFFYFFLFAVLNAKGQYDSSLSVNKRIVHPESYSASLGMLQEMQLLREQNQYLIKKISALEVEVARIQQNQNLNFLMLGVEPKVELYQNAPNPFQSSSVITYRVEDISNGSVSIWIYDMRGNEVRRYENLPGGLFSHRINAKEFKAGTYIYHLVLAGQIMKSKIMLISKQEK
ncbi:MAG: T9SS type A sorting domain-containing protein [Ekhidna sp.]